jgi:hypothetical protein
MRCPDCNKFVSYGEAEVEVSAEELNEDAVSAEVRVMLPCAECGTELKEANLTAEEDLDHACAPEDSEKRHYIASDKDPRVATCKQCNSVFNLDSEHWCDELKAATGEDEQFTLDQVDGVPTDRRDMFKTVATTKAERAAGAGPTKQKPIPARSQVQYYGAEVTFDLTCHRCGERFQVQIEVEETASGYDELV